MSNIFDNEKEEESLRFVVSHYSDDAFSARRGWERLGIQRESWWRRHAVAASVGAVVLAASAAITLWHMNDAQAPSAPAVETVAPSAPASVSATESRRIEFSDASLPEVVAAIEHVYGVKVSGHTDSSERLTLSYEGSATGLVDAINELLGTDLRIESGLGEEDPTTQQ